MSYACTYQVPADEQMYARVKAEVGDEPTEGLIVHLVVKGEGGLRHTTVWESRADWERFRDGRVRPAVARALTAAGFAHVPPASPEQDLDVVDVLIGSADHAAI